MTPKTIFCDESGFDGNNLWNPSQPHFVYAAVEISPDDADSIVSEARSRFSIAGDELHAARMLRRNNGRLAIEWILDQISGRYELACFHKRFSLACKFFEYMIEPTISDGSNYFYHHGFHKFVANGLFFAALAEPALNEQNLKEFQELIRERDAERMTALIEGFADRSTGEDAFLHSIATVLICNQSAIRSELEMLNEADQDQSPVK